MSAGGIKRKDPTTNRQLYLDGWMTASAKYSVFFPFNTSRAEAFKLFLALAAITSAPLERAGEVL